MTSDSVLIYDKKAGKAVDVCRAMIAVVLCIWAFQPILYSIVIQFTYNTQFVNRFVFYGWLWYTYWANPALIILGSAIIFAFLLMLAFLVPTSDMKEPFDKKSFFKASLKHLEFYFLGAILLWSIISLFFSPNFNVSFFGFDYYKGGVLYYFFYAAVFIGVLAVNDRHKKCILNSFVITSVFLAIFTLLKGWQVFIDFTDRLYDHKGILILPTFWAKTCAIFSNLNFYGYYLSFAVILSGAMFFFERRKVLATLYLLSFVLNEYVLLLNAGRGAFLSVVFSIVFFSAAVCISRKRFYSKIAVVIGVFFLVLAVSRIWTSSRLGSIFSDFKLIVHADEHTQNEIDGAGSRRNVLWRGIFDLILLAPLFGNGIDCYAQYGKNLQYWIDNYAQRYRITGYLIEYPHNEFLQLAYGAGLPVLVFYVAALAIIYIRAVVRNKQLTNLQLLGLSCAAGYIASSFFGNGWSYMIPNYLIFLAIGIGCTIVPSKRKKVLILEDNKAEEDRIRAELLKELETADKTGE